MNKKRILARGLIKGRIFDLQNPLKGNETARKIELAKAREEYKCLYHRGHGEIGGIQRGHGEK